MANTERRKDQLPVEAPESVDPKVVDSDVFFQKQPLTVTDTTLQMPFVRYATQQLFVSFSTGWKKSGFWRSVNWQNVKWSYDDFGFRLLSVYSDPPELPRMLHKTFIRLPERLKAWLAVWNAATVCLDDWLVLPDWDCSYQQLYRSLYVPARRPSHFRFWNAYFDLINNMLPHSYSMNSHWSIDLSRIMSI